MKPAGKDILSDFLNLNFKLSRSGKSKECHHNARVIAIGLKKLGYDVIVKTGFYVNYPKMIRHSWIEFEDKILETDCWQLRVGDFDSMPNECYDVLDKKQFQHRYLSKEQWEKDTNLYRYISKEQWKKDLEEIRQ
jgi:hypothetical protein